MPIPEDDDISVPHKSPILQPLPDADLPKPIIAVPQANPAYQSVAIDLKQSPARSIISYVAGSNWTVDWYSQVATSDTSTMGQAPTVSGVYQQYRKIVGLVLKVTNALSYSQSDESRSESMTGTALVFSKLVVNEGDQFVADVGIGKPAVFRVTNTKKNSQHRDTTYEIEYQLDTADPLRIRDLDQKVVSTYVYRQDFLVSGQSPFVIEQDHADLVSIAHAVQTLTDEFFGTFYNNRYSTLLLPNQVNTIYDAWHMRFVDALFDTSSHIRVLSKRTLSVQPELLLNTDSIFDLILRQSDRFSGNVFSKAGVVSTQSFRDQPALNNIAWTGISYAVYPTNSSIGNGVRSSELKSIVPLPITQESSSNAYASLNDSMPDEVGLNNAPINGNESLIAENSNVNNRQLKGITYDDYYVFSEQFYKHPVVKDRSLLDPLERLVWDFLQKKQLDSKQLLGMAQNSVHWDDINRFYYLPVLIRIMRNFVESYGVVK
jgi:hypothetical protein